jgi:hypothetical protein
MNDYRRRYREVERDGWWTAPRAAAALVAFLVLLYGLGFLVTGGDLAIYRFWAPKRASAEREVFVNTQGYVQGKVQYLARLRRQYQAADSDEERRSLRGLIIDEAATIRDDQLPPELANFVATLRSGR